MFALAAQHGLKMRGLDIYCAFITAFIDSPVYLQLPKGLRPDIHGEPPIWKLKKTLYGLKRAPKAFYDQAAHGSPRGDWLHSVCQRSLPLPSSLCKRQANYVLHARGAMISLSQILFIASLMICAPL